MTSFSESREKKVEEHEEHMSLIYKKHTRVLWSFDLALQDLAFKYRPSVGSWLMPRQPMRNAAPMQIDDRCRICRRDRPCRIPWPDAEAEGQGREDEP